jgi:hypothetical protein
MVGQWRVERRAAPWRFAAAKARGVSHVKSDMPCQDRFVCEVIGGDILGAVVCDGAGSAARAEEGAEIASSLMMASMKAAMKKKRKDWGNILYEGALIAREGIFQEAEAQGNPVRDYACTLLAAAIGPEGGAAIQIGDGVIVTDDGNGGWSWVFWPQHGEFVNTTRFLIDPDAADILMTGDLPAGLSEIALTSDGLEQLMLHFASKTAHKPFFDHIFRPLEAADGEAGLDSLSKALETWLSSAEVANRTDDDVSLILATRRPRPAPA